MYTLTPVEAAHAEAVLSFEKANRAYFAATIGDRGDDFFAHFEDSWTTVLALHDAGTCRFHLLLSDTGEVAGRFNLLEIEHGTANVGYRLARHLTGRGLATGATKDLCERARDEYALHTLNALVADTNRASQRVLTKNHFTRLRPATAQELPGKPAHWYSRPADYAELSRSGHREAEGPAKSRQ